MQIDIERLYDEKPPYYTDEHFRLFAEFKATLGPGGTKVVTQSIEPMWS